MVANLILSAVLPFLANLVAWRGRHLALASCLAWGMSFLAGILVCTLELAPILLLTPLLLAVVATTCLVMSLGPRLFVWPSLAVVGVGCVSVALLSEQQHLPLPVVGDPNPVSGNQITPDRPGPRFYSDLRLFVCTKGTGLDPRAVVTHLPGHVQTLPEIHARYVQEFTLSDGFGMERCHWSPAWWVELVPESPSEMTAASQEQVYSERADLGSDPRDASAKEERPKYDSERDMLIYGSSGRSALRA
jgi:hypothetical protein